MATYLLIHKFNKINIQTTNFATYTDRLDDK